MVRHIKTAQRPKQEWGMGAAPPHLLNFEENIQKRMATRENVVRKTQFDFKHLHIR